MSNNPAPLLSVSNLQVTYGNLRAVQGISFEVNAGEIVAIIGPNGAGKTSTMAAVSGLIPIAGGRIVLDGVDLSSQPAYARALAGLVHVPQGRRLFTSMTVRDNLLLGAHGRGRDHGTYQLLEQQLEAFPILRERMYQQAGTLSGGEQQMLAIARALMGRPKMLLLDEPTLGLAPRIVTLVGETIRSIRDTSGMGVLLAEQNALLAFDVADRVLVLESGVIVAQGKADELRESQHVRETYLGA